MGHIEDALQDGREHSRLAANRRGYGVSRCRAARAIKLPCLLERAYNSEETSSATQQTAA